MEMLNCSELVYNKQKDKEDGETPMSIVTLSKMFKYIQRL